MDYKSDYQNETKRYPYCWSKDGIYAGNGSYTDSYVYWLETKLNDFKGSVIVDFRTKQPLLTAEIKKL